MQAPNIVLVITHDTGKELGCYGAANITPRMDRIASEGLRFDQMFAAAPQCSPSRASLMTGKYPQNHGLMELEHRREAMACDPSDTLPKGLKAAGYDTHLFGFHHEREDPLEMGYDAWHADPENKEGTQHYAPRVFPYFKRFIEAREESDRPFFACLGFHETHLPFERPGYPASDPAEVELPPWLEATDENRHAYAHFQGTLRVADEAVGWIDDLLAAKGLRENTLFIFTTDHGIDFPRAKQHLYDVGLETALLMRWPGRIQPSRVDSRMRSNIDLMPTLIELVGGKSGSDVDGQSFLSALHGDDEPGRVEIFAGMTYHVRYKPMRCIRTERYKYIRFEDPEAIIPLSPDPEWLKRFKPRPLERREELYELATDPHEKQNLAESGGMAEVKADLRQKLDTWMATTNDPLLTGPVSKWAPPK